MENEFSASRRAAKAEALARVLLEAKATPERVDAMTDAEWKMAAAVARCNPPGSQATKDLVVKLLRIYRGDAKGATG